MPVLLVLVAVVFLFLLIVALQGASREDWMILGTIIAVCSASLVFYGFSRYGVGLTDNVAKLLLWIGSYGPLSRAHSVWFASSVIFVCVHTVLAPYQLTHVRVNRNSLRISPWVTGKKYSFDFSGTAWRCFIIVLIVECSFLSLVLEAVQTGSFRSASLMFRVSLGGRLGYMSLVILGMFIMNLLLAGYLPVLLCRILIRSFEASDLLEIHVSGNYSNASMIFALRQLGYMPIMLILIFFHRSNPHAVDVSLCFLLTDLLCNVVWETISLFLDWRNNCWVKSLRMEAIADGSPQSRRQAQDKWNRLKAQGYGMFRNTEG